MAKLPSHLFIGCEGYLYNTRKENWHKHAPLRSNYSIAHKNITSVADLKATLRYGSYTSLGCYPLYLWNSYGAVHLRCVSENFKEALEVFSTNEASKLQCDINYEDTDLYCEYCGTAIESAYSEETTA